MPKVATPLPDVAATHLSQGSETISILSEERPVLLVFLRHFGCTFCREAVCELEKVRPQIERLGTRLVFVHLSSEERAKKFFRPHRFEDLPRFADPEGHLYEAFGLVRARWKQYLNPQSIARMLRAWAQGNIQGASDGDVERMPGVFLIYRGEVIKAFRHKLVSDRPDYVALATLS